MSGFLEKSHQNLAAAKSMIEEKGLFTSSVSRSYYALMQNMFHHLFFTLPNDYEQYKVDAENKGSHIAAFQMLQDHIKCTNDEYKWLKDAFFSLKSLREKADYSDKLIAAKEAGKGYDKAADLMIFLDKKPFIR